MLQASVLVSAASGRIIPATPQLTYSGTAGSFIISNFDSSYTYSVTGNGNISGNLLIVTSTSGNATITVKSPKGVSFSSGRTAYRQNRTYTTVNVPYTQCYNPCNDLTFGSPTPGVWNWSCGCGSGCNDSGGGQWGVGICRGPGYSYQTEDSYSGSGYTFSSSGNEWYKIG